MIVELTSILNLDKINVSGMITPKPDKIKYYEDYFLVVPTSNCCIPNFLMAISGSCLLGWLFLQADTHLKMFGQGILKVFGFLGSISLELYCVEEWLGNRLRTILDLNSKLLLNVIVFACIICSAYLLHVICKLIRRIFTK